MQRVEFHIYDIQKNLIQSDYNIQSYSIQNNIFNLGLDYIIDNKKLFAGNFKYSIRVYKEVLGGIDSTSHKFYLQEISDSKTEIRIVPVYSESTTYFQFLIDMQTMMGNAINFGGNRIYRIINSQFDNINFPFSLILKLDTTIDLNIGLGCFIIDEMTSEISDNLVIQNQPNTFQCQLLSIPNFDIKLNNVTKKSTDYHNYNSILGIDYTQSSKILSEYLNNTETGMTINIDYSDYSNFIFYSVASDRLNNFMFKLKQIQKYESDIIVLMNQVITITVQNNINILNDKINEIKRKFDGYDNYLYNTAFPRINTVLVDINSNIAKTWYENEIATTDSFDESNIYCLLNVVPATFKENEHSRLFISLLAQHFDIIYLYIKNLDNLRIRNENIENGISKELISDILGSYGWNYTPDLFNVSFQSGSLNNYILAVPSGSLIDEKTANTEISNRILNNVIYLYKTKGTENSVKGLMNCFGIPDTILNVNEYESQSNVDLSLTKHIFNYSILFQNSNISLFGAPPTSITNNCISVDYYKLGTIEFRLKTDNKFDQTIIQNEIGNFLISIIYTDNNNGYIQLNVNGDFYNSDTIELFDNDWHDVLITHNDNDYDVNIPHDYSIQVGRLLYGNVDIQCDNNITINNQNSIIFNESYLYYVGYGVSGSLQEYRNYSNIVSLSEFETHIKNPLSYYTIDTYNNLKVRLCLGSDSNKYNHYLTSSLNNQCPNFNNSTLFTYNNFSNEFNYIENYESIIIDNPNIGTGIEVNNKIRFIENLIGDRFLDLNNTNQLFNVDKDKNSKIGVYLSETKNIDSDIVNRFGQFNIDDYIGEYNNDNYELLDSLKNLYYQNYISKYNVKFYQSLLKFFNFNIFEQLNKVLPDNNFSITGYVVKSHILHRNKLKQLQEAKITDISKDVVLELPVRFDNKVCSINNQKEEDLLDFGGGVIKELNAVYRYSENIKTLVVYKYDELYTDPIVYLFNEDYQLN